MGGVREFDYAGLPFEVIAQLYRDGWGWKGLAKHFGAPDHHTFRKYALRNVPALEDEERDHSQAQRARRRREAATAAPHGGKQRPSTWWGGGR